MKALQTGGKVGGQGNNSKCTPTIALYMALMAQPMAEHFNTDTDRPFESRFLKVLSCNHFWVLEIFAGKNRNGYKAEADKRATTSGIKCLL